jgi:hypothetical protein
MPTKCEVCGKPLAKRQTNYCSRPCQYKYRRISDRQSFLQKQKRYATVKEHRCPTCGGRITTKHCFACDMQARQDERLELERQLKNENARVRERRSNQPEPVEATRGEPAQIRSYLHHPDIIASTDRRDGVRNAGSRPDAPAKRRRKRNRDDHAGCADEQRTAAG